MIFFFDVKILLTNVLLHKIIDFSLKKLHHEKKTQICIPKALLKKLLYLCTKDIHFTFNNNIYIQCDGVSMGSPLGSLQANNSMA